VCVCIIHANGEDGAADEGFRGMSAAGVRLNLKNKPKRSVGRGGKYDCEGSGGQCVCMYIYIYMLARVTRNY